MRYRIVILLFFVCWGLTAYAQELRCNVSVSGTALTRVNQNLFRNMQADLQEFMNNRKWTNNVFSYNEKIRCSIVIRFTEQVSSDQFKGSIQVSSSRPVYNSSFTTSILNIKDEDFKCKYVEFQPLEFDEMSNSDNLTNVMAFYAYMILGFDYDTFSPEGGTTYFEKAQAIVNNSQNLDATGWHAYESEQNRYWLVENVLNKSYSAFRSAVYKYHRKGLDMMSERVESGRANVADALRDIQKVYKRKTSTYILQVFFDTKSNELVNIFSQSYADERTRVLAILNEVDPSNAGKYEKISESADDM